MMSPDRDEHARSEGKGDEDLDLNRRILVIDDNRAIHADFGEILGRNRESTAVLVEAEAEPFGDIAPEAARNEFQIDSAYQGERGLAMVRKALAENRPYSVAFVDVRMPPGWDGIETAARIWEVDPNIQIVVCTAYSDYSWEEMLAKLGRSDRLVILKKPFDNIEVLQLADALTRKWQRAHEGNQHLAALQELMRERSNALTGSHRRWAMNDRQLALAAEAATSHVQERMVLEHELRRALEVGELSVHYQPLVEIASQRIVSLEALVRWRHPVKGRGWIPPSQFIPVAEESDLILALGDFVLRTACTQIVRWEREGVPVVPVAVNISPMQLRRQDLARFVRGVLDETRMRPNQLALELTENALIENMREHSDTLQSLRRDGVSIEIDDFGTGYSSLSHLRYLPVDTVKIDRSFISRMDANPADAAIVGAIIDMAHSLTLNTVAEGVETTGQLEMLGRHGCDVAQGYFFARPLPAEDSKTLLTAAARRETFTDTLRLLAHENPLADMSACA